MLHLLNLAKCVKRTSKTFKTAHFCARSLAMTLLVVSMQIRELELYINLRTLDNTLYKIYGWPIKFMTSTFFLLLYISRG